MRVMYKEDMDHISEIAKNNSEWCDMYNNFVQENKLVTKNTVTFFSVKHTVTRYDAINMTWENWTPLNDKSSGKARLIDNLKQIVEHRDKLNLAIKEIMEVLND